MYCSQSKTTMKKQRYDPTNAMRSLQIVLPLPPSCVMSVRRVYLKKMTTLNRDKHAHSRNGVVKQAFTNVTGPDGDCLSVPRTSSSSIELTPRIFYSFHSAVCTVLKYYAKGRIREG